MHKFAEIKAADPVKLFSIPILLAALAIIAAPGCRSEDALEWKESWEATYTFNRERFEKEFKAAPRNARRPNGDLPAHMVLLLEALLKKYPDDQAHKLGAYAELADQLAKMEARSRSCEYHKKIIDENRGKPEVALSALQNMLKVYPRYYETPEARKWQEYAGRRLMALYRIGYISNTNPALNEAMECLLAVHSAQGRFLEAAQILDALKAQNRPDDRIRIQEAELYFKLGHIEKALECYQEIPYAKQDRQIPQRIALLSSHRWSSIAQQQYPLTPEFDKRWQNILDAKVEENLPSLEGLILDAADGKDVVTAGSQFASAWSVVDAQLRTIPEKLESLRQAHADDAAAMLASARKAGRVDELMPVFRKYPWTESGHAALLEYGERQLIAGRAALASRAFQDVLSYSISKTTLAQAQTGLQISAAQNKEVTQPQPASAVATPPKKILLSLPAIFPWPREMVEEIPAEIRPSLSWPGIEITALRGITLLSAPNLLICFGVDLAKPRWVRAPAEPRGLHGVLDAAHTAYFHAPAPLRPAVAGGVVYMRWGLDATRCYPSHLAAFDLDSGETLWSTERDQDWQQISPIGDPAFSDGKLYAMVIENGSSRSASALPLSVICLDAKTGATLWQRQLANHQLTTLPRIGEREREWDSELQRNSRYADMFHYGNAVTVDGGAVYCITNCGVVARVDARDGVIEWLASYSRTTPNTGAIGYLQREGAAPLISGNRAIFMPRDNEGVFALNKDTGKLLWENPFAPSQTQIAPLGGSLLLADRETIVSLDPATGRARWFRSFVQGIACRPVCDETTVVVATGGKLQRILSATGASVDETPLENGQTPAQLALRDGALLLPTLQNLQPFPYEQKTVPAPAAAVTAEKLALPLKETWQLVRPNPELILPPQSAGVPGRVIVSSEGLLECVDAAAAGKIVWQRFVPPGLPEFAWDKNSLLLLYPRHVDARNANSGELTWRCELPFSPEHWLNSGPYLFFSDTERSPQFGTIDLVSGKLLWSKHIDNFHSKNVPMAFDGKHLNLFNARSGEDSCVQLIEPLTGQSVGMRPILSTRREQLPRGTWIEGTQGFYLSEPLMIFSLGLQEDKTVIRYHADLREAVRRADSRFDAGRFFNWESHFKSTSPDGRWMDIEHYAGRAPRAVHFIFDRNDPEYMFRRGTDGAIRGDKLFDSSGNALVVIDLPSKTEVARYTIPTAAAADANTRVVDYWQNGAGMWVVSGDESAGAKPGTLRIDLFDLATCAHRSGQVLADVPYWKVSLRKFNDEREPSVKKWRETQVFASGSTVTVTDAQGVHGFAPMAEITSGKQHSLHVAYRQAMPIVPDGSLQEWAEIPPIEPNAGGGSAQLRITHDAEHLYLAVSSTDARIQPRYETQELAAGDWLEIGLGTGSGNFRGRVALDARGQTAWENAADADNLPGDIQAGVRGDLAHGTHTYELAIPLRAIVRMDDPAWRRIGLSVAVWEQSPLGPRKTAEWGEGLARRPMQGDAHRQIYLDSITPAEEQAAWTIVHKYPELKASKAFVQKISATRGVSSAQATAYLEAILKTHAHDPSAEALLEAFDFSIRSGGGDVLKLAEAAGVDAAVRERFAALSSAAISQWVYLDPTRPPRMLMLQLNDGSGWEHRISWGDFEWPLLGVAGTASRRLGGGLPPRGSWQELRAPLLWLGMQNTPIHGISFGQHGGGRVYWDRTALIVNGKETPLIDGEVPDGKIEGQWEWLSTPKRAGARAHANRAPLDPDEALSHGVSNLKKPFSDTLVQGSKFKVQGSRAELLALLETEIPKLGSSDEAIAFLDEMLALETEDSGKIARLRWFLSALPRHPANSELLGRLLEYFDHAKAAAPAEEVEAIIKAAKLPPQTAYDYRRKYTHTQHKFVRHVQVLGPFPDPLDLGHDAALPPEGKAMDLAAKLQMGDFVLEWKALKSERDYIDLGRALKPSEHVAAFAACYIQCQKARGGMLEISADDGCKVWINQKLVHAHRNFGVAAPGQFKSRIFLTAGVNEILVKVDNKADDWGLFMEFVESDGRGPMQGIEIFETPP